MPPLPGLIVDALLRGQLKSPPRIIFSHSSRFSFCKVVIKSSKNSTILVSLFGALIPGYLRDRNAAAHTVDSKVFYAVTH